MIANFKISEVEAIFAKFPGWLPPLSILTLLFLGNGGYGTLIWVRNYIIIEKKKEKKRKKTEKGKRRQSSKHFTGCNIEIGAYARSNICYLICLRHLIRSRAVTNWIFSSSEIPYLTFMRAQHAQSYHIICVPWY